MLNATNSTRNSIKNILRSNWLVLVKRKIRKWMWTDMCKIHNEIEDSYCNACNKSFCYTCYMRHVKDANELTESTKWKCDLCFRGWDRINRNKLCARIAWNTSAPNATMSIRNSKDNIMGSNWLELVKRKLKNRWELICVRFTMK